MNHFSIDNFASKMNESETCRGDELVKISDPRSLAPNPAGDPFSMVLQLVASVRDGASVVVTGASANAVAAKATSLLAIGRTRVISIGAPLDLAAFINQIAPSGTGAGEAALAAALRSLTTLEPPCDRTVLVVRDAEQMPEPTLRCIDMAMAAAPHLTVVLAGTGAILNTLALPALTPLRDRIKLHLAIPEASAAAVAPEATGDRSRASHEGVPVWIWPLITGAVCGGGLTLYLLAPLPNRGVAVPARPANVAATAPAKPAAVTPRPAMPATAAPVVTPAAVTSPAPATPPKVPALAMVDVPGGKFEMGSTIDPSERPIHKVLVQPFKLSRDAITVRDWVPCVAAHVCTLVPQGAPNTPVTNASFADATQYAAWLSTATGHTFRLPTEAEWEYAARAGSGAKYAWGESIVQGKTNCHECGTPYDLARPPAVESLPPNAYGLYGMGGGVAEWVQDCWHGSYQGAPQRAELAWTSPTCALRVVRGGSWMSDAIDVRPASRDNYDPTVRYPTHGFRLAETP
jgi:formylglycine-generating enzyme required for sulfatase activity